MVNYMAESVHMFWSNDYIIINNGIAMSKTEILIWVLLISFGIVAFLLAVGPALFRLFGLIGLYHD